VTIDERIDAYGAVADELSVRVGDCVPKSNELLLLGLALQVVASILWGSLAVQLKPTKGKALADFSAYWSGWAKAGLGGHGREQGFMSSTLHRGTSHVEQGNGPQVRRACYQRP
jgi:hypothetical protein